MTELYQLHEILMQMRLYVSRRVFRSELQRSELRNLTFMGSCIVNIFHCISNKMQLYTVYLYLETALHVSGGIST
jgi:hypothetical protein